MNGRRAVGAVSAVGALIVALAAAPAAHASEGDDGGWAAEREELRAVPIPYRAMHTRTSDSVVVYMNGEGVRVTPGADDPERGTSSLAWDSGRDEVYVPAFSGGSARWSELVECVRAEYAAFSIEITDKRRSSGDYIMLIVGGRSDLFGLDRNVAGSATFSGGLLSNGIGYAFEKNHGGNARLLCETAAHEIGHTLGLDHEYLCEDLMSYLRGCGEKHFIDEVGRCGEFEARECHSDEKGQNTFRSLAETLGMADGSTPPPLRDDPSDRWDRDDHDRGDDRPDRDRGGSYDGGDDGGDDGAAPRDRDRDDDHSRARQYSRGSDPTADASGASADDSSSAPDRSRGTAPGHGDRSDDADADAEAGDADDARTIMDAIRRIWAMLHAGDRA